MEWLAIAAVVLVVPVIGIAVAARRATPMGPVLLGAAGLVAAEIVSGFLLLLAAFSCDESCDDRSSRWHDDPDAWQWDLVAALAFAGALFAAVMLFALVLGRRRLAPVALGAAAIAELVAYALIVG